MLSRSIFVAWKRPPSPLIRKKVITAYTPYCVFLECYSPPLSLISEFLINAGPRINALDVDGSNFNSLISWLSPSSCRNLTWDTTTTNRFRRDLIFPKPDVKTCPGKYGFVLIQTKNLRKSKYLFPPKVKKIFELHSHQNHYTNQYVGIYS